ncbi:nuclear transport factor 2 family protein [Candidatus Latescibacterota bacterium]
MSNIIRFLTLSLVIVLAACQGAGRPMTDAERSVIRDACITKHAEMLESALSVDADGLFSHFADNSEGALAYDGVLHVTRESALNVVREGFSGLKEQEFEMVKEYVNVISPEVAVLTGTGTSKGTTKAGETFGGPFVVSIVFVKVGDEWKVLHMHESLPSVSQ